SYLMVTLTEVHTVLLSMNIILSSLKTHNVNRCVLRHHLARHHSLHSFPTRRSSDLRSAVVGCARRREDAVGLRSPPAHLTRLRRSEEHTSELQSRSDLVCRLLLEKKKNDHILAHYAT